jgi:serine/threonine protein kinase
MIHRKAALVKAICRADFGFPSPEFDCVSPKAKDLISKILVVNPKKRLTIEDIRRHPWMATPQSTVDNSEMIRRNLKSYNSKRKFKGGGYAFIFMNNLKVGLVFGKSKAASGKSSANGCRGGQIAAKINGDGVCTSPKAKGASDVSTNRSPSNADSKSRSLEAGMGTSPKARYGADFQKTVG